MAVFLARMEANENKLRNLENEPWRSEERTNDYRHRYTFAPLPDPVLAEFIDASF